ncbi:MAG: hypothetical protein R3284_01990 [Rubricoccaceae bacterium]|nr:hypothetical protein [Rubricoccaceae bacterium]
MRILICFLLFYLAGCESDQPETGAISEDEISSNEILLGDVGPLSEEFGDYWYQGLAEITSYDLEQARYGEIRQGVAVLIFVTEPFSPSKQVKLDVAGEVGTDEVTVLKLNHTRNFVTGIYPYSMMTSSFLPISEGPMPLKVTATSQEWCGHTFTQLNRTSEGYRARLFSYFESEGDQDLELADVMLEDGLWSLIRINPDALPTGEIQLVPSAVYQRMSHTEIRPYTATATLSDREDGREYRIHYPDVDRTLSIFFSANHPFEISGWEETRRSGFGEGRQMLTTRAIFRAREMLAYWQLNGTEDIHYRERLGLE